MIYLLTFFKIKRLHYPNNALGSTYKRKGLENYKIEKNYKSAKIETLVILI